MLESMAAVALGGESAAVRSHAAGEARVTRRSRARDAASGSPPVGPRGVLLHATRRRSAGALAPEAGSGAAELADTSPKTNSWAEANPLLTIRPPGEAPASLVAATSLVLMKHLAPFESEAFSRVASAASPPPGGGDWACPGMRDLGHMPSIVACTGDTMGARSKPKEKSERVNERANGVVRQAEAGSIASAGHCGSRMGSAACCACFRVKDSDADVHGAHPDPTGMRHPSRRSATALAKAAFEASQGEGSGSLM